MNAEFLQNQWVSKSLAVILMLALLAPIFGWAAGTVGYTEPIDVAAEITGAADEAGDSSHGLFPGYTVPGVGNAAGTFVTALLGVALTLGVTFGAGRLLEG